MNVAVRPEGFDLISICTGGGGLDLGVELAIPDARSVVLVEREAFAAAQLVSAMQQGLMAPAPVWSDARTFDGRAWRGAVDGLIGGIPCQPHSLAGRKRGQLDGRDLWSDARRIAATARPWFVLIENVAGMLSAGDDEIAGAERVWRDLRKLGYAVEGGLFTAAEVGASHERERIFILAVADSEGDIRRPKLETGRAGSGWSRLAGGGDSLPGVGLADPYGERLEGQWADAGASGREDAGRSARLCDRAALVHAERAERRQDAERGHEPNRHDAGGDQAPSRAREPSPTVADADLAELRGQSPARQLGFDEPNARLGIFPPGPNDVPGWRNTLERASELEPAFRRVADGLASRLDIARVDRLRLLGNGVVPLEAAYAIRTLATRLASRGSAGAARLVRGMRIAA